MSNSEYYFELLGNVKTSNQKALLVGVIFTLYTLEDIHAKIQEHRDGWNGVIGRGCQIMSRILYQL